MSDNDTQQQLEAQTPTPEPLTVTLTQQEIDEGSHAVIDCFALFVAATQQHLTREQLRECLEHARSEHYGGCKPDSFSVSAVEQVLHDMPLGPLLAARLRNREQLADRERESYREKLAAKEALLYNFVNARSYLKSAASAITVALETIDKKGDKPE